MKMILSRQYQVTSNILLHKIVPRTSFNSVQHKVTESICNSLPNEKSCNPDYLGIETDEDVVIIKPQKHHQIQTPQTNEMKEQFYRASFGIVRYDLDNKLKYHGQYGKKFDFIFPHSSYSNVKVSKIAQSLPNNQVNQDIPVSDPQILSVNKINDENNSSSLLEEKDESLNYIDECYFNNSEKVESEIIDSAPTEMSFLDKNFFVSCNGNQNDKITSDHASSDISELTKVNFFDKKFQSSINDNLDKESVIKNSAAFFIENNSIIKSNLNDQLNEEKHESKAINQKSNMNPESSEYIIKEFRENAEEQASQDNFKHIKCNKRLKNNTIYKENFELSTNNPNISDDMYNKNTEAFSKDINLKNSKSISSKIDLDHQSEANDQVSTAHDFVQKLRNEREIPNQSSIVTKRKSGSEEQFDSKGFRILKNQVLNLSYFTRDEILNMLKQNVVYSDDDLIVLNKPYNLVIHESQTTKETCLSMVLEDLAKEMDQKATDPKLFTVHRLDKETTGCLLLARNEIMAMKLKSLFAQRKIIKKYWIITSRVPDPPEGIIDIPISEGSIDNRKRMVLHPKLPKDMNYKSHSKHGKSAVTSYKVIWESGNAALVEATPVTGLKHQIRVHFGFGLGCPILGDHKYSHLDRLVPQKLPSDILQRLKVRQSKVRHIPMHIHAKCVVIPEYFEKRNLFVNIPIPDHMKINLKRLKFKKKDMI